MSPTGLPVLIRILGRLALSPKPARVSCISCEPPHPLLPSLSTASLLPDQLAIASGTSLVPALDTFMTDLCYVDSPCSNATLMEAANTISTGCATDIASAGLTNSTIDVAFGEYALVREVLCLKT